MRQEKLISRLIDLEEEARTHDSEYLKLVQIPGSRTKASLHHKKALRLRSRIHDIIRQIARNGNNSTLPVLAESES